MLAPCQIQVTDKIVNIKNLQFYYRRSSSYKVYVKYTFKL